MVTFVIKLLVGLFVILVLPKLIIKKKGSPWKSFVDIACWIVGLLIIVQASINFIKMIFS